MSVRPFSIEFYLPRATRADQVAALLERVEAHTLETKRLQEPVEEQRRSRRSPACIRP